MQPQHNKYTMNAWGVHLGYYIAGFFEVQGSILASIINFYGINLSIICYLYYIIEAG